MQGVNTAKDPAMASLSWSGCHMAMSSMAHLDHRQKFHTTCQEIPKPPLDQRQQLFPISHQGDTHQIKVDTSNGPINNSIFFFLCGGRGKDNS